MEYLRKSSKPRMAVDVSNIQLDSRSKALPVIHNHLIALQTNYQRDAARLAEQYNSMYFTPLLNLRSCVTSLEESEVLNEQVKNACESINHSNLHESDRKSFNQLAKYCKNLAIKKACNGFKSFKEPRGKEVKVDKFFWANQAPLKLGSSCFSPLKLNFRPPSVSSASKTSSGETKTCWNSHMDYTFRPPKANHLIPLPSCKNNGDKQLLEQKFPMQRSGCTESSDSVLKKAEPLEHSLVDVAIKNCSVKPTSNLCPTSNLLKEKVDDERSYHLSSNNQQQTSEITRSQLEGTSKMLQQSEASEAKSSTDNLATIGNENLSRKRRMTCEPDSVRSTKRRKMEKSVSPCSSKRKNEKHYIEKENNKVCNKRKMTDTSKTYDDKRPKLCIKQVSEPQKTKRKRPGFFREIFLIYKYAATSAFNWAFKNRRPQRK